MDAGVEKQIRKVFRRDLLRISEYCQQQGEQVMAANPTPEMESYYTVPATKKMRKADFESGGASDFEGLQAGLGELWARESCPHFATLATRIAKLARSVRASEAQSSELSQFVYVMY